MTDEEKNKLAKTTLDKIFKICQNTPVVDSNKDPNKEAQRLDDAIAEINNICDIAIYELGHQ
jgi:hypothetical protein